mgnify:CR=1 FL=1
MLIVYTCRKCGMRETSSHVRACKVSACFNCKGASFIAKRQLPDGWKLLAQKLKSL